MEEWLAYINTFEEADAKTFLQTYHKAQAVLADDLSPLEKAWFVQTLLWEPVNLLHVVPSERSNADGHHRISLAFKLLSNLITKYSDVISPHLENIAEICMLTYDSKSRPNAMHCLALVVPHSELAAKNYMNYVRLLDNDTACKAPIAELVGAICEHHRDMVAEDVATIWRVYLNLLDNNLSDTVKKSLLIGVQGLMKSFGEELSTAELNLFYDQLIILRGTEKCKEGFLKILQHHSWLFPERLAADGNTREAVWHLLALRKFPLAQKAVLSVYQAVFDVKEDNEIQAMLESEVSPKVEDDNALVRFTALRVLGRHGNGALAHTADAPALECKMRRARLSHDDLETVLWCIETHAPEGEILLKAALLYYNSLSKEYRDSIAVLGLLNSPTELRKRLVAFLAKESCRSLSEGDSKCFDVWRSLFDTSESERAVKCETLFKDYLDYLVDFLQRHLSAKDEQESCDTLEWTLKASARIVPLANELNGGTERCIVILRLLRRLEQEKKAVEGRLIAARSLIHRVDARRLDGWRMEFSIEECRDDDELREGCLATLLAPVANLEEAAKALTAVETVFSVTGLEANALSALESLIVQWGHELGEEDLSRVIEQVLMLHQRWDYKGKDGRELRRNVLIFLGKFGRDVQQSDNSLRDENCPNSLVLKVMNLSDDTMNKINLQALFRIALKLEDPNVIRPLLDLLRANSSERALSENEERALCAGAYALARTQVPLGTHLLDACSDVAAVPLLQYLGVERRPSVRRTLCAALRRLAVSHKHLEGDQMAHEMANYARRFLTDKSTKPVGVDVSEVLLDVLKHQNSLAKELLPPLLLQIAETRLIYALNAFKTATDLFMDKIELFDEDEIRDLISTLLKALKETYIENGNKRQIKDGDTSDIEVNKDGAQIQDGDTTHKMADLRMLRAFTSSIVHLIKELCERKAFDLDTVLEPILTKEVNCGALYTLSVIRSEFSLNEEECRRIAGKVDKILFGENGTWDFLRLNGVLTFCIEYMEALLDLHREDTVKLLSDLLSALQPQQILAQEKNLSTCFRKITALLGTVPELQDSFEKWCTKLPLEVLEENLLKGECPEKDVVLIKSLKDALKWFGITDPGFASLGVRSQRWLNIVLKHNSSGLVSKRLSNLEYFNNLLHLSFIFNESEVMKLLIKDLADGFSERFMPALFQYLIKKPYIMMEDQVKEKYQLLNDVVKECARRRDYECSNILELVDQMWPTYEPLTDFNTKHSLLLQMAALPLRLAAESKPMRWVKSCIRSRELSPAIKAKLVGVIPVEEDYMAMWRDLASLLPATPLEVSGGLAALFHALLAALASNCTLLECLAPLLTALTTEEELGWREEAVEACLSAFAAKGGLAAAKHLYEKTTQSLRFCTRLLAPLLSRCSSAVCEEFFSEIVSELLATLQSVPKAVTPHYMYLRTVVDYTKALILLRVAFEKIPRDRVMSPRSLLYSKIAGVGERSFYLAKEVGNKCVHLAKVVKCPEYAYASVRDACQQFHCENYNCLTAAVCAWAPEEPRLYSLLFDAQAWLRTVDPHIDYELPIRPQMQRWGPSGGEGGMSTPHSRLKTLTRTRTRTRTFLDSLSENPTDFDLDLHAQEQQELYAEESLPGGGLNGHPCAKQLTSAIKLASRQSHVAWVDALVDGLKQTRNVSWLIAQVICNCREELKPFASTLRPALLAMIVTSCKEELLNGLHVDSLDVIVHWHEDTNSLPGDSIADLNTIVLRSIATCVFHKSNKNIVDAVLARLDSILDLFGNKVTMEWECLKEFVKVTCKDTARSYFGILECITRRKVRIAGMFNSLMEILEGESGAETLGMVGQVGKVGQLGRILAKAALVEAVDVLEGESGAQQGKVGQVGQLGKSSEASTRLRKLLEKRRSDMQLYLELLHGIQSELPTVCDLPLFRSLVALTSRTVERTRSKVLNIIATHIRNFPTEECSETLEGVRILEMVEKGDEAALKLTQELFVFMEPLRTRLVYSCMKLYESGQSPKAALAVLLKAFDGLMQPKDGEPKPKRVAGLSSPLLGEWAEPMAALGLALADKGAKEGRTRVASALPPSDNPRDRFTEAFILCVYLPMTHRPNKCSSANFSALLEIFFLGLKEDAALKQPVSDTHATGTFQTSSMEIGSHVQLNDEDVLEEARTVGDVLNAVLQFTERSAEASSALWLHLCSALWRRAAGFEPAALLAPLLGRPSRQLLLAARLFVDDCCAVDGFKQTVEVLTRSSKDSEDRDLILLLHKDVLLRTSPLEYFCLGKPEQIEDIEMMESDQEFSLKGLEQSFGCLSNWDQLTLQQKDSVRRCLPPLWTDPAEFQEQYKEWDNSSGWKKVGWLSKMASAHLLVSSQSIHWLSNLEIKGKAPFDIAATVEAVELNRLSDDATDAVPHFLCDIKTDDCLVEWSARLMARSACLNDLPEDKFARRAELGPLRRLSLSHALEWCRCASERAIHAQVLQCIRTLHKDDKKSLGWLNQELAALRGLALNKSDELELSQILRRAEIESVPYMEGVALEDFVEFNKLQLQLHTDLKSLSREKLRHFLDTTREICMHNDSLGSNKRNKKELGRMAMMAFMHYDAQLDIASNEQDSLLMDMTRTLDFASELNLEVNYTMLVDVILNRLSHEGLSEQTLNAVADRLEVISHLLDDFALEALDKNPVTSRLSAKLHYEESFVEELKRGLQLVSDPEHSLKMYCRELYSAVEKEDVTAWANTFKRMKGKIFENPLAGADYKVLGKYQSALYASEDMDLSRKESIKQTVLNVTKELTSRRERLRLSQLCPALTRSRAIGASEIERVARLLMLPEGGRFYKFEEQVTVFTDSVRRPTVVTIRLSDGRKKRLMVKCGESLRRDAAAIRVAKGLPSLIKGNRTHYDVQPLSEESGLIEFLEDHERLRTLICSRCDINGILDSMSLPEDEESNLDPKECLRRFKLNCDKIPAHSLRSAMELRCASVEEFLAKKRRFQESLGVATFSSWILGLGDRHLDNVLYSHRDGSVILVDWNSVLRHGRAELPPARLTRALLAPCTFTVLESHLQRLVSECREVQGLLLAVFKISFQWMGAEFESAFADVSDLLSGRALPHQISLKRLEEGKNLRGAKRAMQVLNEVFGCSEKDGYSIQEQVSNLLLHCTDPRVLSVTRSPWEPWV